MAKYGKLDTNLVFRECPDFALVDNVMVFVADSSATAVSWRSANGFLPVIDSKPVDIPANKFACEAGYRWLDANREVTPTVDNAAFIEKIYELKDLTEIDEENAASIGKSTVTLIVNTTNILQTQIESKVSAYAVDATETLVLTNQTTTT